MLLLEIVVVQRPLFNSFFNCCSCIIDLFFDVCLVSYFLVNKAVIHNLRDLLNLSSPGLKSGNVFKKNTHNLLSFTVQCMLAPSNSISGNKT